jgi:hypothetical protein
MDHHFNNKKYKNHLWFLGLFLTSKPLIKILLFLDYERIYFKLSFAITCFLKFCIIFPPFYFRYLSPLIIQSNNLFRRYWLTFNLKFIDLSNYYKFPLLNSTLIEKYFWKNQLLLSSCRFNWISLVWYCSLSIKTHWTKWFRIHLNQHLYITFYTFNQLCNLLSTLW